MPTGGKKKDILKVHVIRFFFSHRKQSEVRGRISNEAVCLIIEGMNQMKT